MDFKRHWKASEFSKNISLGAGIIKGSVHYTSLIPKGDPKHYQANVNEVSIGRFEKEEQAIEAVETNITNRIIKILNQVGYGVQ